MASTKGTILVTGANGGLGNAITRQLTSRPELVGYHRIYVVRDATTATTLASTLRSNLPHSHDILSLDLTKLNCVREVAKTVNERVSAGQIPPIRAVILNAGYQDFGKQDWTDDGLDKTFCANYLGHWLLTLLLLKSMDKERGRLIVIGSQAHE